MRQRGGNRRRCGILKPFPTTFSPSQPGNRDSIMARVSEIVRYLSLSPCKVYTLQTGLPPAEPHGILTGDTCCKRIQSHRNSTADRSSCLPSPLDCLLDPCLSFSDIQSSQSANGQA